MISMRTSMEQSLKCREVGFEMAIYWYRVAEGHKLRLICSQGSYCIGFYLSGRRRKFGFNVHITINIGQLVHRHETIPDTAFDQNQLMLIKKFKSAQKVCHSHQGHSEQTKNKVLSTINCLFFSAL